MTIEEYDSKASARATIENIDKIISDMTEDKRDFLFKGIGTILYYGSIHPYYSYINDPILKERFKNLLIERKQELIKEYFE